VSNTNGVANLVVPTTTAGIYNYNLLGARGNGDTTDNIQSASATVNIRPVGTLLATQGNGTYVLQPNDGLEYVYRDTACRQLFGLLDSAGGNSLGYVSGSVAVDYTVRTFNGRAFLQRHYDIQPSSDGPAVVTLFATQAEFDSLNNYLTSTGSSQSRLPTGPSDFTGINNLIINQFHGQSYLGYTGPNGQYDAIRLEVIPNSAITTSWNGYYWSMRFRVSGFSGFFISTASNIILPIKLLNIAAKNEGTVNKLTWNTASEDAGDYFEVERSTDGITFSKIATVAGKYTTGGAYGLTDTKAAQGINYYRLKMMSRTGQWNYSKVVTATVGKSIFIVEAYPNPVKEALTIRVNGAMGNDAKIFITDVSGKPIKQFSMNAQQLTMNINGLATGVYLLKYTDSVHTQTLKITKQ
jgi:hypothetical protein